jgi:hypothetical protein
MMNSQWGRVAVRRESRPPQARGLTTRAVLPPLAGGGQIHGGRQGAENAAPTKSVDVAFGKTVPEAD